MDMALDATDGISDEALLVLYANGDGPAARALTLRLTPRAYAQAFRMLGDRAEAEDVTQDALMRLWKIAPDWRQGEAQVSTWLWRVVANLATDRLRKRRRVAPLEDAGEPVDDTGDAPAQMQTEARRAALAGALAKLPERQRRAVELRHFEGLGNPEIAAILGISVEAVESLTARGKRALARALEGRKAELGYTDDEV
ncbi:MAG: RNA polymerase sigma factor [Marinovum algicola]|jgi:RNA polymerase sigma factor (sigma-70 family)|uniref:RNA polymerase, sigma subunit, ECF family n=1 Tax=Marinovum algicola TaxID=42444 RepID=A0A975ZLN1_9RHOB|nr:MULTISPECIES: RNA polymerase sigma factor [Marinovum]MDD9740030.1 RNA polymerase sigma factor [Marinovum sp. SP66]SEI63476.1 RNA polymerase, sigma subunit, ECF family [Marinovum algicola]SLN25172.1 ECF RNA polymerase sigma factor SigE [Marinovum algicola]